jgi:hypothetical protein
MLLSHSSIIISPRPVKRNASSNFGFTCQCLHKGEVLTKCAAVRLSCRKSHVTFVLVYFVQLPWDYFEQHDWLICTILDDTSHWWSCHSAANENVAIVNGENLSVRIFHLRYVILVGLSGVSLGVISHSPRIRLNARRLAVKNDSRSEGPFWSHTFWGQLFPLNSKKTTKQTLNIPKQVYGNFIPFRNSTSKLISPWETLTL